MLQMVNHFKVTNNRALRIVMDLNFQTTNTVKCGEYGWVINTIIPLPDEWKIKDKLFRCMDVLRGRFMENLASDVDVEG